MNQSELKQILSSKFDFEVWKPILESMFLKMEYLSKDFRQEATGVNNPVQFQYAFRRDDGVYVVPVGGG